jgi:hypothetical protein
MEKKKASCDCQAITAGCYHLVRLRDEASVMLLGALFGDS